MDSSATPTCRTWTCLAASRCPTAPRGRRARSRACSHSWRGSRSTSAVGLWRIRLPLGTSEPKPRNRVADFGIHDTYNPDTEECEPNDPAASGYGGPNLVADAEGVDVYYGPDRTGYVLASSQGDDRFAGITPEARIRDANPTRVDDAIITTYLRYVAAASPAPCRRPAVHEHQGNHDRHRPEWPVALVWMLVVPPRGATYIYTSNRSQTQVGG